MKYLFTLRLLLIYNILSADCIPLYMCSQGYCSFGTFFNGTACVECPENQYMDLNQQSCRSCKPCTKMRPGGTEYILQNCTKDKDTIMECTGSYKMTYPHGHNHPNARRCELTTATTTTTVMTMTPTVVTPTSDNQFNTSTTKEMETGKDSCSEKSMIINIVLGLVVAIVLALLAVGGCLAYKKKDKIKERLSYIFQPQNRKQAQEQIEMLPTGQ